MKKLALIAVAIMFAVALAFLSPQGDLSRSVQAQSATDPTAPAAVGIGPALPSICRPNGGKYTAFNLTVAATGKPVGLYRCSALNTWSLAASTELSGTASLNFGATAANDCDDLTITVTGAADGDVVSLGVPTALASSGETSVSGFVSASNTVTVRRCNHNSGGASPDPAAATVRAQVTKF